MRHPRGLAWHVPGWYDEAMCEATKYGVPVLARSTKEAYVVLPDGSYRRTKLPELIWRTGRGFIPWRSPIAPLTLAMRAAKRPRKRCHCGAVTRKDHTTCGPMRCEGPERRRRAEQEWRDSPAGRAARAADVAEVESIDRIKESLRSAKRKLKKMRRGARGGVTK